MTNKNELLEEFFEEPKKWREYKLSWCEQCDTAIISCPDCKNSSCNGGSCEKCDIDFTIFCTETKKRVQSYLTKEECKVIEKGRHLRRFILKSLGDGTNRSEINWQKLKEDGELSSKTEELFKDQYQ